MSRLAERLTGKTLLVDMRICQLWRERGIPRYVQSLLLKMHTFAPGLGFVFLYDRQNPKPLRHDDLILQDVVLQAFNDSEPANILKPIFDSIWRAMGLQRSLNFDDSGLWKPRSWD